MKDDDSYLQAQQEQDEQEYELWLYEMEAIEEINKELNCEKYIPSFS